MISSSVGQRKLDAIKVSKDEKIRNRYNQVPHLTQDTNGKVTNSHLDTTNESQEVSPFPAGEHKAHINRRAERHCKRKTETNIKYPQKKYRLGTVSKIFYWRSKTVFTAPTSPLIQMWIKTQRYLFIMIKPDSILSCIDTDKNSVSSNLFLETPCIISN